MTHQEIIAALPELSYQQRQEIFAVLGILQDRDILAGIGPSEAEKKFLDAELEEYERDGDVGIPWEEAFEKIRSKRQE